MIDLDMQTEYKTKDRDYRYFVEELKYYQRELNLMNWRIYCDHVKTAKNHSSLAWTTCNVSGMNCTISLGSSWGRTDVTDRDLSRVAFHECCEVLLWKIGEHAEKSVSETLTDPERHSVIRTLENILFPVLYKKRQRRRK
jgi:hypothetical protein